jgi:hypothetical protein
MRTVASGQTVYTGASGVPVPGSLTDASSGVSVQPSARNEEMVLPNVCFKNTLHAVNVP